MKLSIVAILMIVSQSLLSQVKRPEPFAEAKKAIASVENEPAIRDSLKKCYDGRWMLAVTYGQRFVAANNKTSFADSLTLTDFTSRRSFYGLSGNYFLSRKVLLGFGFDFLFLPKLKEITSRSGFSGRGRGSGGLMFSMNLSAKYYFAELGNTRPYAGLALGREQLLAKGGNVSFSLTSGTEEDLIELREDVFSAAISTGVAHRMAPGSIFDFSIGYSFTNKVDQIGGITSPGGIKAAISLQFILNPRKK